MTELSFDGELSFKCVGGLIMNHSHIALGILGLDYKVRFERQFHYSYKHNKRVFIQGS